jgi:hypothetical protein
VNITITDEMRREAAEFSLRLPSDAERLRNALRKIAFTPFVRIIDEDEWRALLRTAEEEAEEEDSEEARETREARRIFNAAHSSGRAR